MLFLSAKEGEESGYNGNTKKLSNENIKSIICPIAYFNLSLRLSPYIFLQLNDHHFHD